MAGLLYRLGRFCAQHAWPVVALWAGLLLAAGSAGAALAQPASTEFSIPGTESFDALNRLGVAFPGGDGTTAQVVFLARPGQRLTAAPARAAVAATVAGLQRSPQVLAVVSPFLSGALSPDAATGFATVQYRVPVGAITPAARAGALAALGPARAAGLRVEVGGPALLAPAPTGFTTEVIGVLAAMIVLAVTFGALVAAALPLLTALVAVGIGLSALEALSPVVRLSATAPVLAVMIGLAVSIDYALFLVSRHRSQLAQGMTVEESIARATGTAGSAVVFAGATVVTALAGLAIVRIPFLTVMGLAAAGTVVVAVLVAVTLLPAVLALLGPRIGAGRLRRVSALVDPAAGPTPLGARWVRLLTRRPALVLGVGLIALVALALPAGSLQLGIAGAESAPTSHTERRAYDLVSQGFGPGANGPLLVLVQSRQPGGAAAPAAAELSRRARLLAGVLTVAPPRLNATGSAALLTITPRSGPADPQTKDLVGQLRALAGPVAARTISTVAVTGSTALTIDISARLAAALPPFLAVITALALLLLGLLFRSVAVPVKAVVGFLLTIAAALGAVVAVFQWGWLAAVLGVTQVGPILNFLPVLLIGILFGLAMDYEVFLVSRMREEHVLGADAGTAIEAGFTQGARVVTAAALIMVAVFAGFFFGNDLMVKPIGFALAFGVLIDAFVVRMTLVPAALALLGERAWTLPGWLDRALPHLDIEGIALPAPSGRPEGPLPAGSGYAPTGHR